MRKMLIPAALVLALAACSEGTDNAPRATGTASPTGSGATARLVNGAGDEIGTVTLTEDGGGVVVRVEARDLEPGFHGLHVHATGRCDGPGFTSAGGHHAGDGDAHGAHDGDLPSLLVGADGTARLETRTDRLTLDELDDADGAALVVHAGPDNFGNVPTRYGTPDEATRNTGDSGDRVACAVLFAGEGGTGSPAATPTATATSPTGSPSPTGAPDVEVTVTATVTTSPTP